MNDPHFCTVDMCQFIKKRGWYQWNVDIFIFAEISGLEHLKQKIPHIVFTRLFVWPLILWLFVKYWNHTHWGLTHETFHHSFCGAMKVFGSVQHRPASTHITWKKRTKTNVELRPWMLIVNLVVKPVKDFCQCLSAGSVSPLQARKIKYHIDLDISSLSIIGDFQKQKEGDVCCISMVIKELFRYSVLLWNNFLMYHDDIAVEYIKFTNKFIWAGKPHPAPKTVWQSLSRMFLRSAWCSEIEGCDGVDISSQGYQSKSAAEQRTQNTKRIWTT